MRVFVVGAGASAAAPARLPIFGVLRKFLIQALHVPHNAATAAAELAPERFMQSLYDAGLPLAEWLSATLGGGNSNAVHVILAEAIARGDVAWTLNVDELIEAASRRPLRVASFDDATPTSDAELLKPHGTIGRRKFLFRTDQVARPLPAAWAAALVAHAEHNEVVVIGYAAADLDMRLALDDMFAVAESILWFAVEADRSTLLSRFPSLHGKVEFRGSEDVGSLTPAFLDWADDAHLSSLVTADLRAQAVAKEPFREPAPLTGDASLATALILERSGDRAAARKAYLRLLLRLPTAHARLAATRLRSIDMYSRASWTKPLHAVGRSRLAHLLPTSLRRRLDRVDITLMSSHEGRHADARKRAMHAVHREDPAIVIALAKSARFEGNYADAVALAEKAERGASADRDIDVVAHALFELAITHTWAGDLRAARSVVSRLYSGVDGLAGVRWIAWGAWQQACLKIYANDATSALLDLDRAQSLFEADRLQQGIAAALTVKMTATRLLGDFQLFDICADALGKLQHDRGWTTYTSCSVDLEKAERARSEGDSASGRASCTAACSPSHRRNRSTQD